MILQNDFELLPCSEEDYLSLSKKESFCFPPHDPLQDDDPVSLDTFFCKVVPEEANDHFVKTYKFVKNSDKDDILALASISNSSFSFGAYESKPSSLRDSGFNEAFPAMMLDADLAEIYGYETKRFNEQVKNNESRFAEDFRFLLTKEEVGVVLENSITPLLNLVFTCF